MELKNYIRTVPNWPKPGIMFRDITTILQDPTGFRLCIEKFLEHFGKLEFDKIVAIESRGFVFGSVLAYKLGKGLVPARKPGKLPAARARQEYQLEYGTDAIEMHLDALKKGEKVVIIDDLLATGGTALAAAALCEQLGAEVLEFGFVINLPDIGGAKRLKKAGYGIFTLTEFEGD